MSWNPKNLANLLARAKPADISRSSVFQQRWVSKRELRGYHVPNINERQFIDRHFAVKMPVKQASPKQKREMPPIQALMFGELERRVDVVVFRSHFASSIWQARNAVVSGHVLVNGEKVDYIDIVQVPCPPAR